MSSARKIAGIAAMAGAGVLAGVALLWPAGEAAGARHTPMHINCKHHSHGTTKARDAQVAKFRQRHLAKREAAEGADLAARSMTARRSSPRVAP